MPNHRNQNQGIQNFPDDLSNLPRRQFLKRMLGATATVAVMPQWGFSEKEIPLTTLNETTAGLPQKAIGPERYWKLVKRQFLIREGLNG